MTKKIKVPFYSQYMHIEDPFWMPRACGMCCLKMVLDYHGLETGEISEMCIKGRESGGYSNSGWIHDYFLSVAKGYGLNAHREEDMDINSGLDKIVTYLDGGEPVIVSCIKKFLNENKFHMILIVGYEKEEDGSLKGFYLNEPESLTLEYGECRFVDIQTFLSDWRRMAIFIGR